MRTIHLKEKKRDVFEDRKYQLKIVSDFANTVFVDFSEVELIGLKIILDEKFSKKGQ